MTIKIDDYQAPPREVRRGSPQGSVLGCLLYCITTQRLTLNLGEATTEYTNGAAVMLPINYKRNQTPGGVGLPAIVERGARIQHFNVEADNGEDET